MDKRRQERINAEIKKIISVALRNMKDPDISMMTTVTDVKVTSDLGYCDLSFSIMGTDVQKKKHLEVLERAAGYFRSCIAKEISLRLIPEVRVHLDESMEYADKINSILKTLNIDHSDEAGENDAK